MKIKSINDEGLFSKTIITQEDIYHLFAGMEEQKDIFDISLRRLNGIAVFVITFKTLPSCGYYEPFSGELKLSPTWEAANPIFMYKYSKFIQEKMIIKDIIAFMGFLLIKKTFVVT